MNPFDGMAAFARVVEAGSFTRAAAQLGTTKSSVSEAVRRLEDRLGVRLLNRTTRRVSATQAGQAFYARCRRALQEAQAADHEAQALHAEPIGRLRVAAPEAFARLHLVPVLPSLLDEYPALQVEIVEGAPAIDLVREGFDLAVRIGDHPPGDLAVHRLGSSEVVVAGAPAYLAARGAPVDPEELGGHRTIGFSPLFWSHEWRFARDGERVAVPVTPCLQVNSGESLRAAALAGVGLAALPRWLAAGDLASGALVQVLVHWRTPPTGVFAVHASDREIAAPVKLFVDHLARHLRDRRL